MDSPKLPFREGSFFLIQSMIKMMARIFVFVLNKSWRLKMDKRFGYYVLLGLLIGAVFGQGLGSANENTFLGLGIGALVGVFLGWFIAAAVLNQD